jgi:glycosyltransferase involved in cell wall biosynthesis
MEERDGVTLLRAYSQDAGLPGFRFFYPRLWKTLSALRTAKADVYVASGASLGAGWTYDTAGIRRARFVFFAASDKDADPSLPALERRRERWWYTRALRGADALVAQTDHQRRLFRANFDVDARVIPNPVEIPVEPADPGANKLVLWLSTYKESKRPDWFLELARRLPQVPFVMAGYVPSIGTNRSWHTALATGTELPNLDVRGFIEHASIGDVLRSAALFVHTSPLEGFPNTLLEAWSYGVPTVSAVDPDGIVERCGIGAVAETFERLESVVTSLMSAPDTRRDLGSAARRYVADRHGPEQTFDPLAALLDAVIGRSNSKQPS